MTANYTWLPPNILYSVQILPSRSCRYVGVYAAFRTTPVSQNRCVGFFPQSTHLAVKNMEVRRPTISPTFYMPSPWPQPLVRQFSAMEARPLITRLFATTLPTSSGSTLKSDGYLRPASIYPCNEELRRVGMSAIYQISFLRSMVSGCFVLAPDSRCSNIAPKVWTQAVKHLQSPRIPIKPPGRDTISLAC